MKNNTFVKTDEFNKPTDSICSEKEVVLKAVQVEASYGDHRVLRNFDLEIRKGEVVGLIGPNGVGKSTFLKCITGIVPLAGGKIYIDGDDSERLTHKEKARRVAVVPQSFAIDYEFTVEDMVMMGRNPYYDIRKKESESDGKIVEEAMRVTETWEFRDRYFNELSGGERQRVIVARAIAQGSDILLLDEPTSALDIEHQIELMELILRQNKEKGKTVIAVLHDLNMASRYCDRLILLKDGAVYADGTPSEVITQANLRSIYNMDMIIRNNSIFDRPEVIPIRVLDPQKVKNTRRIHVICGSGEAGRLLEELTSMGHLVSAGVLNRGADDWIMAHYLGLPMIETEPFSIITPEEQKKNLELMNDAEFLLIADVPFGKANVENLKGLDSFKGQIYIHRNCFHSDYTPDKEAVRLLETLKNQGAEVINDHSEFVEIMKQ